MEYRVGSFILFPKRHTQKPMQKWQQKKRQKAHELKVQNAKSSMRKYSNSRERAPNSGRIQNSTPKSKYHSTTPINKILEIFQLEKYGPLLAAYGFPEKLTQRKSMEYLDEMMEEVAERDKERFLSLLNTLTIMSKDVQKNTKTPKSASKQNKIHYPPPPSTSMQNRQPPNSVQKSEKASVKFRVKEKNTINSILANKKNLSRNFPENVSRKTDKTRENSVQTAEKRRKRSVSNYQSRATDDLSLIHDFTLQPESSNPGLLRPITQSNKIIQRLTQKLQTLDPQPCQKSQQLNLQLQKIKQMYLSFDSATLTSNIINIDLHQMIECLAMEVKALVAQGQVANLARSHKEQIRSLLQQSFVLCREESKESRNLEEGQYLEEKCKDSLQKLPIKAQNPNPSIDSLPQQLPFSQPQPQNSASIKKFHEMREIDLYDTENQNIDNLYDTDRSSQQQQQKQHDQQNCSIDLDRGMKESSIWGNSCIASVINDFSCFDNIYEGTLYGLMPMQEDFKNFIQLVVMAGRMEKEVPIIAYIYLNRLLTSHLVKQGKVTNKNWRNLLLVTLIEASKIWDDQSLENHSFAKLIKPYTTLQINRLEKYLLFFLDYRLTIDQKEYSQAYFKLRKHVGQKESTQSVNLMRLDLKTIRKLQQSGLYGVGGEEKRGMGKKEYFKRLLNKSF